MFDYKINKELEFHSLTKLTSTITIHFLFYEKERKGFEPSVSEKPT